MNSQFLKFTDVNDQCASAGYAAQEGCPYAEIWITTPELAGSAIPDGDPIASHARARFSGSFIYSNGQKPIRTLGSGVSAVSNIRTIPETTGGTVMVQTDGICWYLDSQFCSGFHDWKRSFGSARAAAITGAAAFSAVWILLVAVMLIRLAVHINLARRLEIAKELAASNMEPPPPSTRVERVCKVIVKLHPVANAFRLLLLVIPWPFYQGIFFTCWRCFDFEAAVAHEVGHLLGLGHPDLVPKETLAGYAAGGSNSYHVGLSAGVPLDSTTCLSPWAGVTNGWQSGAELDPLTGVRPSIMSALTLHNPRSCLAQDDLEAINVLYPDCSGSLLTPVCDKSALNLGLMRILLYLLIPFLIALATVGLCHYGAMRKLGMLPPLPSPRSLFPSKTPPPVSPASPQPAAL